jgi:hypothetical protein
LPARNDWTAVAEHAMASYMADVNVGFGLANPALYALLVDPAHAGSPALRVGWDNLGARIHRVAGTGRLRVPERRALEMVHAAGVGAVLALLSQPPGERDTALADAMYEAVMRSVLVDAPA